MLVDVNNLLSALEYHKLSGVNYVTVHKAVQDGTLDTIEICGTKMIILNENTQIFKNKRGKRYKKIEKRPEYFFDIDHLIGIQDVADLKKTTYEVVKKWIHKGKLNTMTIASRRLVVIDDNLLSIKVDKTMRRRFKKWV